jgi:hypothetical protein
MSTNRVCAIRNSGFIAGCSELAMLVLLNRRVLFLVGWLVKRASELACFFETHLHCTCLVNPSFPISRRFHSHRNSKDLANATQLCIYTCIHSNNAIMIAPSHSMSRNARSVGYAPFDSLQQLSPGDSFPPKGEVRIYEDA